MQFPKYDVFTRGLAPSRRRLLLELSPGAVQLSKRNGFFFTGWARQGPIVFGPEGVGIDDTVLILIPAKEHETQRFAVVSIASNVTITTSSSEHQRQRG